MATMIKEYAKEYIEAMKEEPETQTPTEPPTPTQTNESEEWDESMTAEALKDILERGVIHGDEKNQILVYATKKEEQEEENINNTKSGAI